MFYSTNCALLVLCCIVFEELALAASCSERLLLKHLFQDYDPHIRPVLEQSTTLEIDVWLRIYSVISVIAGEETIRLIFWINFRWKDEFLVWSPSDFAGCDHVVAHAEKVWRPPIVFTTARENSAIVDVDRQYVRIDSDGTVRYAENILSSQRCEMKISDFPFDTQICKMKLSLWTLGYDEARYVVDGNAPIGLENIYNAPTEFVPVFFTAKAQMVTTQSNDTFSEVLYSLALQRLPDYYIYVMVVPAFLLTALSIIGSFTPNHNLGERNERVTLGLTTLLSLSVILTIVAGEMPISHEGLPIIGHFILYEIGMCSLAILLSTVIIFLDERAHTQEWTPPNFLYCWAGIRKTPLAEPHTNWRMKNGKLKKQASITVPNSSSAENGPAEGENQFRHLQTTVQRMQSDISELDEIFHRQEAESEKSEVWTMVFDRVDVVCMLLMLAVNCLLSYTALFIRKRIDAFV